MSNPMVLEYNGYKVFFDPETKMGNLTSIWDACGRSENNHSTQWLRLTQAEQMISVVCEIEYLGKSQVLDIRRGRNGGVWAHWQVTTAYAYYLDRRFAYHWNEWARAHIEGGFVLAPEGISDVLVQLGVDFRKKGKWRNEGADVFFEAARILQNEPESLFLPPEIPESIKDMPILDPKHSGIVYLFRVDNKPGQYKVGFTQKENSQDRAKRGPGQTDDVYVIIKEIQTNDAQKLETKIKRYFSKRKGVRVNAKGQRKQDLFNLVDLDIELFLALPDYIDADLFKPEGHLDKDKQGLLFSLS